MPFNMTDKKKKIEQDPNKAKAFQDSFTKALNIETDEKPEKKQPSYLTNIKNLFKR